MLQNAYLLAKIGADTAENEQHFAEILPTDAPRAVHRGRPARLSAKEGRAVAPGGGSAGGAAGDVAGRRTAGAQKRAA